MFQKQLTYLGTQHHLSGAERHRTDSIVSGFTQYVFAKVEFHYLVLTYDQEYSGTVISINEAKAGDLLFWDRAEVRTTWLLHLVGDNTFMHLTMDKAFQLAAY